jgi:colanic acid/amylovoran biosynthesis glycosyltransferase
MRLAYLINQYPLVSHAFIRREILALERRGFEITRISLRGWDRDLADPDDLLEREHTHFILREGALVLLLAMIRLLLTRPLALARAFVLTCRMSFRSERPLFVHLVYLAEACLIVLKLQGRSIQHVHAHFSTNSAQVAMLSHVLGGPPWSFTVHKVAAPENPNFTGLPEKVRRCAFVVSICEFMRGQLLRLLDRRDWQKVQVIHCGIEPAFFATPVSPPPPDRRLVCVGRLCTEKAQVLLIEAARRLAEMGDDFELILAGDGELRGDLESLIARYQLRHKVHITGWLGGAQVKNELLAARALVLPSLAEGLPVVIMEAMALRRPVISTYVAGIPELVRPYKDGWLVPCGNVELLTQAMQQCLDAPSETLHRMGEAAHKRVLERHNIEIEADQLAQLFRSTLNSFDDSPQSRLRDSECSRMGRRRRR